MPRHSDDDVPYPEFTDRRQPHGMTWEIRYTISRHVDHGAIVTMGDLDALLEHWQALSTSGVGESLVLFDGNEGMATRAWVGTNEAIVYTYPS
jgi:hypothetical protein